MERIKGYIKKYIQDRGFGFIKYGSNEIFFHFRDVDIPKENIKDGINVEFSEGQGRDSRPAAKSIKVIGSGFVKIEHSTSKFSKKESKNVIFVPKDTESVLNGDPDNFYLLLNRYARFEDKKFLFYKRNRNKEIINLPENFKFKDVDKVAKEYKSSLEKIDYEIGSVKMKPDGRFVVGLGSESVYETSITLHHIYGFPYIPGQAVKGVLSSWFVKSQFEDLSKDNPNLKHEQIVCFEKMLENYVLNGKNEKKSFNSKDSKKNDVNISDVVYNYLIENKHLISLYQNIFGTQKQKGKISFFDAYPVQNPKLKNDIMNPHYSEYYSDSSGTKPPGDYYNPVPIHFITVEDTPFEFIFGYEKKYDLVFSKNELLKDKDMLQIIKEWIKTAMEENGIGAKTAVGYGYFKEDN